MYVYGILIFWKGKVLNILAMINLFNNYYIASGQKVNTFKSSKYLGFIHSSRLLHILNMTCFSRGSFPFNYLGVPIFNGKVKSLYLKPINHVIISKMVAWKGSTLSMVDRVLLVKFIIQSMLIHTNTCYSWNVALLKEFNKYARNFI